MPLWLKLAYTAWFAAWVPVYWFDPGPHNFLWLCDVANFVLVMALWRDSPLLFSSQAVGILIIQATWAVDFFNRLVLGFHLVGGTEYMFEAAQPLWRRSFSLFHLFVPLILLWALRRLGFDRRGILLQTAITWVVLPATFLLTPAERNLNWVWRPFGLEQTLLPEPLYLLFCLLAYPLVLYLPTHLLLKRWAPQVGEVPPEAVALATESGG